MTEIPFSLPISQQSTSFNLLAKPIQKWIYSQGWQSLRDIQEKAIQGILAADKDMIISAATASGKTEAAFFPALSHLTSLPLGSGVGILYVSPLKALINDQQRRLEEICEMMNLPLTPWHGDIPQNIKSRQLKHPGGVILITPESLEALLMRNGPWAQKAFANLGHIIIDEFHAFIGTERGIQLQSLMHRIEFLTGRKIPRIALSATLGDLDPVKRALREDGDLECEIIVSDTMHSDLKVQLRGYLQEQDEHTKPALEKINDDLYQILRGHSHLVFANSRRRTEEITAGLRDRCYENHVPNEFFAHHGNISKELREAAEKRLQEGKLPTTVIATQTLELGIDVGALDSIAQITPPFSVSSLRQRLGRTGRRGDAAVLRMFMEEDEISPKTHPLDSLRLKTVQMIAMMNLLLAKWYEPADVGQYHFSTLVQQTLSVTAQYGGVRADQLWALLCQTGPFRQVDKQMFIDLLREMGAKDLLTQMKDGQLVLGSSGELLVNNYNFYAAFMTPDEYRIEVKGRALGSVAFDQPFNVEQHIIFAGRRWTITSIDAEAKVIQVEAAPGGAPPKFEGSGGNLHGRIRAEMLRVYQSQQLPAYIDSQAKENLLQGYEHFHALDMANARILENENDLLVASWAGDKTVNAIVALLNSQALVASAWSGMIEIKKISKTNFLKMVREIIEMEHQSAEELAMLLPDTIVEKHDQYVPLELRALNYGEKNFDMPGAYQFLESLLPDATEVL